MIETELLTTYFHEFSILNSEFSQNVNPSERVVCYLFVKSVCLVKKIVKIWNCEVWKHVLNSSSPRLIKIYSIQILNVYVIFTEWLECKEFRRWLTMTTYFDEFPISNSEFFVNIQNLGLWIMWWTAQKSHINKILHYSFIFTEQRKWFECKEFRRWLTLSCSPHIFTNSQSRIPYLWRFRICVRSGEQFKNSKLIKF